MKYLHWSFFSGVVIHFLACKLEQNASVKMHHVTINLYSSWLSTGTGMSLSKAGWLWSLTHSYEACDLD